jgi:pyruvate/2-oxoacid:ferredoxin oxidoreductase alpha subunit
MIEEIKFKGVYSNDDAEYICVLWNETDMISRIIYNKLNTKKEIINYLSLIKIHPDSIPNFMRLLNYTKKEIKRKCDESNKNLKIISKEVDKYLNKNKIKLK